MMCSCIRSQLPLSDAGAAIADQTRSGLTAPSFGPPYDGFAMHPDLLPSLPTLPATADQAGPCFTDFVAAEYAGTDPDAVADHFQRFDHEQASADQANKAAHDVWLTASAVEHQAIADQADRAGAVPRPESAAEVGARVQLPPSDQAS